MKPITLGVFQSLSPSNGIGASWRNESNTATDFLDLGHWTALARQLDQAGVDFLFFADSYGYPTLEDEVIPTAVQDAIALPLGDPITVLSAIAAVTENLGIVATASTTVEKAAAVARRYATLDHLTDGRIGWNIVTGAAQASAARLFGEELIPHDERYDRAEDHVTICLKLWQGSWADDAYVLDRTNGVYARPDRVRAIHHDGEYLSAHGILNLPPSPQRTPVLFQAGASGRGREFAAKYAEAVFLSGGNPSYVGGIVDDIRSRAVGYGRGADEVKILVGATIIVAPTDDEARLKLDTALSYATIEQAATIFAWTTGIDLLAMDLDRPLGDVGTELGQSNLDRFRGNGDGPAPTVREVLEEFRVNGLNGTVFIGSPTTIADKMEEFLTETDADGFLVQPLLTPGTYDDLIELLMPELRARGLLPDKPGGTTLRERLFSDGDAQISPTHPAHGYRFD